MWKYLEQLPNRAISELKENVSQAYILLFYQLL